MGVVFCAAATVVLVLLQFVYPQTSWFHNGSYAASLMALIALQWWLLRKQRADALVAAGATIVAIAGLAASLLAPDTRSYVAGPGQVIPLREPPGILQFPISQPSVPILHRTGRSDVPIDAGGRRTYLVNYVIWTQARTAALIEAFDARGAHLTMTQPQSASASFLSPVLLFAQTKTFGGQNLPVDSFALPAAHRSVNAVLLMGSRPGIFFLISDENGRALAHGFARSGETITLGGLRLRPRLEEIPVVVIASAPYVPVVALGLLLFLGGLFKNRFR